MRANFFFVLFLANEWETVNGTFGAIEARGRARRIRLWSEGAAHAAVHQSGGRHTAAGDSSTSFDFNGTAFATLK